MKKLCVALIASVLVGLTPMSVTPMFDEVDCCIKECS